MGGRRLPADGTVDQDRTLVVWMLAMATVWHYTSSSNEIWEYWFRFDPVHTPAVATICVTGFLAAIYSHHRAAALALSIIGVVVVGLRLPWIPTHLMMELFLYAGIVAAWAGLLLKTRRVGEALEGYWSRAAPLGRWLLILMYFYGTFHKLNPVFMSPDTSCAVDFLEGIPVLSMLAGREWMQFLAIYGTLVVEAAAMCLLLAPGLKYYGMLAGMSFHWLIGISGFGTLAHFSAFALALHTFFLPADATQRFLVDQRIPQWCKTRSFGQLVTALVVLPPFAFAVTGSWNLLNAHFGLASLILILFVFRYGKTTKDAPAGPLLSRSIAVNLLVAGFIVNGAAPYLGLRTTGAVQMFSGLRTEGSTSNHYVLRRPIYLFNYQRDVVAIPESTDWYLGYLSSNELGVPWLKFQRYVFAPDKTLKLPFTVDVNGDVSRIETPKDLRRLLEPRYVKENPLERLYLSFRNFEVNPARTCRH